MLPLALRAYVDILTYAHICTYIYIYIYVCVCVCVIYKDVHCRGRCVIVVQFGTEDLQRLS